jgi:hypothetical protein
VFEDLGYRVEEATALDVDGGEIPGTVFLTDEEAAGGHYDELTAMKRPICRENTACPRRLEETISSRQTACGQHTLMRFSEVPGPRPVSVKT